MSVKIGVLVVVILFFSVCLFFVCFISSSSPVTRAEMRCRDGARLRRRGERPVLRHGDTGIRGYAQHVRGTSDQTEGRRGDYFGTCQVRAEMCPPLPAVKIKYLAE